MFRSVFSRLAAVFVLIIVISFTMIAVIITSIASDHAVSVKEQTVSDVAMSAKGVFELSYDEVENSGLPYDTATFSDMLTRLITNSSINAMVCDAQGKILFCDMNSAVDYTGKQLSAEIVVNALTDSGFSKVTDLGGIFGDERIVAALPIRSGSGAVHGAVFVHADTNAEAEMVSSLVRTMVLSTMWVLVAMLLAIFFVSERTIGPLKSMSRAARQFASGKLDARVHVAGNDEIAELAAAFNSMAESLANLEKLRSTFLGNVSHDLRTPMTTISGFVDGILDGTIPEEKHEYYLRIISTEVKRLSRLVSVLLDISRIQAGERKFVPDYFDICEMGRQIIISFEQTLESKKIDVQFECDKDSMIAYADKDAIYQVLYNITDNAVKFTPEAGVLRMRIFNADKKIHVLVFNEGEGIPEEDLPFVFDRFYKTDKSRSLDRTGVGLGLYICRSVIEAHGEKIVVRSKKGEYCEFEFTLRGGREYKTKSFDMPQLH